jgi:hypothetical protein
LHDEGQQEMARAWSTWPEDPAHEQEAPEEMEVGATEQKAPEEPDIEDEVDDQP